MISKKVQYTISCDSPKCDCYNSFAGGDLSYIKKLLKKEGWYMKGGFEYCPKCYVKQLNNNMNKFDLQEHD